MIELTHVEKVVGQTSHISIDALTVAAGEITAVSFAILIVTTLALWGWVFWQARDTAVLTHLITTES